MHVLCGGKGKGKGIPEQHHSPHLSPEGFHFSALFVSVSPRLCPLLFEARQALLEGRPSPSVLLSVVLVTGRDV